MSLVTATRNEMSFCPGCSHGLVLENLAKALERMGLGAEDVCLVTDIGCIGISDRYFACHTFHGLHGRSLTYAEGIKRAQPKLLVVVLIGDGGCGIGTAHLVHAARRGVGIKVLVCNNFNFGMTGGQHSPTTPTCGIAATAPGGVVDRPLDVCQTVIANGAAHVSRCSALDATCVDRIEAALRSPGFALVDLWELCVAYYVPTNQLKPQHLTEIAEKSGMPFGVLRDVPVNGTARSAERPTGARSVARNGAKPRAAGNGGRLTWPEKTTICMAGSAGQRIRSAVGVIGDLLVAGGAYVAQQDDFPITVRKGHSLSRLIVSDQPIRYAGTDQADLTVLLSHDGLQRLGGASGCVARSLVVAEESLAVRPDGADVRYFELRAAEKAVGKPSAALALLSAALVEHGCLSAEALLELAEQYLTGPFAAENLKAIRTGSAMTLTSTLSPMSYSTVPAKETSR